jgi:hypothetical protein
MWNRSSLEALSKNIPVGIDIKWDISPSIEKYGAVNSLLALLSFFVENSGKFLYPNGKACSLLTIKPMRRKLCDVKKINFTIVGHPTASPLLLVVISQLLFEIYFNYYLFVETKTTCRQYFPSASVIVRCRNFLQSMYTRSPGSWGSDIIQMTFDWKGTFILESSSSAIPKRLRKNFRGFKFIPSVFKYFITHQKLPPPEMKFIKNNGFEIITTASIKSGVAQIQTFAQIFLEAQVKRLRKK